MIPLIANNPTLARHVITLFEVRPDKINLFISNISQASSECRKAVGNLEYNIYRYADDPNKFVIIEDWNSLINYNKYLNNKNI